MKWTTTHSLYTSDEWANLKAQLLLERGDVCECGCGQVMLNAWDCIPHHIVELTNANLNDYSISLNPKNIMLVKHKCHNRIHERFTGYTERKVYLVWGSPASGKSTFVNDSADGGDLVVDIDRVWDMLCSGGRKEKPAQLKACAFGIHRHLLDDVRMRAGKWSRSWVAGTYPYKAERERLAGSIGAEMIHIDTDMRTCLERCGADEKRAKYVRDYFERVQI